MTITNAASESMHQSPALAAFITPHIVPVARPVMDKHGSHIKSRLRDVG